TSCSRAAMLSRSSSTGITTETAGSVRSTLPAPVLPAQRMRPAASEARRNLRRGRWPEIQPRARALAGYRIQRQAPAEVFAEALDQRQPDPAGLACAAARQVAVQRADFLRAHAVAWVLDDHGRPGLQPHPHHAPVAVLDGVAQEIADGCLQDGRGRP